MIRRTQVWAPFAVLLLISPLAGCSGDDGEEPGEPIAGTFVGKVSGTNAFIAIVAAQPGRDGKQRDVAVYLSDGTRVNEWFPGSAPGNTFVATSDDGDAQTNGEVTRESVKGTIKLPDGKTASYEAGRATGAAGLYNMTVTSDGKLRGTTPAGVGITGQSTLPKPGAGTFKLADGTNLKFDVAAGPADKGVRLRAGQVRLIVLPDGQVIGAGKSLPTAAAKDSGFFIRRSSK